MKIEIDIDEKEVYDATHRAIKKAICDVVTERTYARGKSTNMIESAVNKMLPELIEEAFRSTDINGMISKAVGEKAKKLITKMVSESKL